MVFEAVDNPGQPLLALVVALAESCCRIQADPRVEILTADTVQRLDILRRPDEVEPVLRQFPQLAVLFRQLVEADHQPGNSVDLEKTISVEVTIADRAAGVLRIVPGWENPKRMQQSVTAGPTKRGIW